jgi:L-ascorbate metabolism protein UlaG (beta-lactamase superfamily)
LKLTYYGHCAFLWTSASGVRALIDPFGNSPRHDWFLRPFPTVDTDVALVTHDHFDHNAVENVLGRPTLLDGAGEFRRGDMRVRGILDLHSADSGRRGMENTIFVVESGGVRCCHIGDNRHDIPGHVRDELGAVDVLMVTVDDSCHLLSYDQVDSLIADVSPRVVVPMHYYVEGLTTASSTLQTPKGWLETQTSVRHLGANPIELTRDDLPDEREVWVFGPPA